MHSGIPAVASIYPTTMFSFLDPVGVLLRQLVRFGIAANTDQELLVSPTTRTVPNAMRSGVLSVQSKVEHVHECNEAIIEGFLASQQSSLWAKPKD